MAVGAVVVPAADDGLIVPRAPGVSPIGKGRILLAEGQVREAERFTRAAMAGSSDDGLLALWGDIQFRRGDFAEAAKAFAAAVDRNPQNAHAVWGLGRVEEVRFHRLEAHALFAKAYQLDPRDTGIMLSYLEGVSDPGDRAVLLHNVAVLSRTTDPERAAHAVARLEIDRRLAGKPAGRLASEYRAYRVPLVGFRPRGTAQDGLMVTVRINGGRPLRLILDTGARSILIGARAAKNLGLEPIVASQVSGFGGSQPGESQLNLAHSLAIGDVRFDDCLIEVSTREIADGADGVLGAGLFEAFRMRLDAGQRTLGLTPFDGAPAAADIQVIGLQNLLLVRTFVAGKDGWFLLDSGAAYSTVSRDLVPPAMLNGAAANVVGVQGVQKGAYRLSPLSLGVANRTLVDLSPVTLDLGSISSREGVEIAGVLGYSALSRRPLILDIRHGVVAFE
jgi:hypothetical protein